MNEKTNPFGDVMKWGGVGALGLVGIGVFLFSATNNFELFIGIFGRKFEGYVLSALGLTILDIAAVGWIVFGVSAARGVFQRVLAWATGGICLTLSLAAAVSELVIKQSYVERPDWIGALAIGSIIVGLIINAVSITLTHVIDPSTMLAIRVGMKKDVMKAEMADSYLDVLSETTRLAKGQMKQATPRLAQELAEEMFQDAKKELLGYTPGGNNSAPTLSAPVPQRSPWHVVNPATAMGGGYTPPQAPRSPFPQNGSGLNHKPSAPAAKDTAVEVMQEWDEDDETLQNAKLAPKGAPRVTGTRHNLSSSPTRVVRPVPTMDEVRRRMSE